MNFRVKEKLISGSKKKPVQLNKLVQRWSFHSIYEAWVAYEMRKGVVQLYIKNNEVIFSLAWNIIFSDNLKVLVLKFLEMKNMVFLSLKVDGNMIFTDYWKVLVLNFSVMGNTVFFESRSWLKDDIYWLLRSSCFELFGDGKYGLFLSQKVNGKMIFTCFFFSLLWYSRTWKTWFFAQWKLIISASVERTFIKLAKAKTQIFNILNTFFKCECIFVMAGSSKIRQHVFQ